MKSVMAEVVELADEPQGGANNQSAVNNNSFHELNSLKTLLSRTWSDLSNIMTRYHAQIVEKHEELEVTSLCTDATRISQMDNDLKMLRTENGRLVTQILDSKSENTKLRTENRKLKDDVTMKDTLIEKIQNQMAQEALDYQAELASLKEILEARSRGAELTATLIASPDTQPAKRRKVSLQQLPAPRKVATVRSPRVGVSPGAASVTPTRADVTPATTDVTPSRTDVTPGRNLPSTSSVSSLKTKTFKKPSSTRASDSEQSATEDSTSQNDGGFVKLDEVGDESNLEDLEGLVSEQEEYVQGEASALTIGLDSGQEQRRTRSSVASALAANSGAPSNLKSPIPVPIGKTPPSQSTIIIELGEEYDEIFQPLLLSDDEIPVIHAGIGDFEQMTAPTVNAKYDIRNLIEGSPDDVVNVQMKAYLSKGDGWLPKKLRLRFTHIVVEEMMRKVKQPSSCHKEDLAKAIIEAYPQLADRVTSGRNTDYAHWFCGSGFNGKSFATGYIEERVKNQRSADNRRVKNQTKNRRLKNQTKQQLATIPRKSPKHLHQSPEAQYLITQTTRSPSDLGSDEGNHLLTLLRQRDVDETTLDSRVRRTAHVRFSNAKEKSFEEQIREDWYLTVPEYISISFATLFDVDEDAFVRTWQRGSSVVLRMADESVPRWRQNHGIPPWPSALDRNEVHVAAFYALAYLIPCRMGGGASSHRVHVAKSFIQHLPAGVMVEGFIRDRTELSGAVLTVGGRSTKPEKVFCIVGNSTIEVKDVLTAVDTAMKITWTMRLDYCAMCRNIWLTLEALYGLKSVPRLSKFGSGVLNALLTTGAPL